MEDFNPEPLNFPAYRFRVRATGQSKQIFDSVRKRFVALTPEEWVRQNLIMFLTHDCGYPAGLLAVEKQVKVGQLKQRADIVVFNRAGQPWLIAECKAPNVEIGQDTFLQAARYTSGADRIFYLLTNGLEHFCLYRDGTRFDFMDTLPAFEG